MTKPDLSIVIVNWKVRALLEQCLLSIRAHPGDLNLEILVVDNDSEDGTSEMLILEFPEVTTIALPRNIGFARACNLAIRQSQADYILLLNPDTQLKAGTLATMLDYMRQNPAVGILGPKILHPDGSLQASVRRWPTFWSQALILLKLRKLMPHHRILKHYHHGDFDYDRSQPVDQVMGAAMLIRKELIDKIGLLDENFFIWFEEVDYCLRAQRAAYQVVYLAEAQLIHHAGSSFGKRNMLRRQWLFDKSLIYYFWKNKPLGQFLLLLPFIPVNLALTALYALYVQYQANA